MKDCNCNFFNPEEILGKEGYYKWKYRALTVSEFQYLNNLRPVDGFDINNPQRGLSEQDYLDLEILRNNRWENHLLSDTSLNDFT